MVRVVNVPVAELALAAVPTAVRFSRIFATQVLRQWQLAHISEDAKLITSELVTNAVRATGLTSTPEHWSHLRHLAMIQVRFALHEMVLIEVWDREAAVPVFQEPALTQENSRGLMIVSTLSAEWGYYHVPSGGKVVWARLAIPSDAVMTEPEPLPRRLAATELRGPRTVRVERDPRLLGRVHQRLIDL
jgi:hypothetical protein